METSNIYDSCRSLLLDLRSNIFGINNVSILIKSSIMHTKPFGPILLLHKYHRIGSKQDTCVINPFATRSPICFFNSFCSMATILYGDLKIGRVHWINLILNRGSNLGGQTWQLIKWILCLLTMVTRVSLPYLAKLHNNNTFLLTCLKTKRILLELSLEKTLLQTCFRTSCIWW